MSNSFGQMLSLTQQDILQILKVHVKLMEMFMVTCFKMCFSDIMLLIMRTFQYLDYLLQILRIQLITIR